MKKLGFRGLIMSGSLLPLLLCAAVAQDAQAPAKPAEPSEGAAQPQAPADTKDASTTTVTVTATKPVNRIDRQVYDTKADISNQTGTAADALNKVPSVNVDTDGNVTLRGNSGVKIMVDGRSSVMMSQDNRAATLQSMSASDIDSVEVINNPSAAFGSEGSGGIINIVMRKNRKPGKSATFIASAGAKDRYNASLSGNFNTSKFVLSGGLSIRKDGRKFTGVSSREITDALTGDISQSEIDSFGLGHRDSASANFGFDYNLNANDTLGISLAQSSRSGNSYSTDHTLAYSAAGALTQDYTRVQTNDSPRDDAQVKVHFDHKGNENAETLKLDVGFAKSDGTNDRFYQNTYILGGTGEDRNRLLSMTSEESFTFNGDYNRNLGKGQLAFGFAFDDGRNVYDNSYYAIDSTGAQTPNGLYTNRFELDQFQSAAYVTYQRPLSEKWTVMGGLRVEQTTTNSNQVTTASRGQHKYTDYYPSMFLAYSLSDTSKLRFSYSKRSQAPRDSDLNPFLSYVDAQNVSSGNVDLDPQITHSFEVGYEYSKQPINASVRGFYRKNVNVITDYSYFISPEVLLTTKQNGGESQSGGLEFSLSGLLSPKLKASFNGNVNYTELTAAYGATSLVDNAISVSGRGNLDYSITPNDRIQFMAGKMGKQLTGQGYRAPMVFTNLSYRHQVTPKFAVVANVNDVFGNSKFKTVTEIQYIKTVSEREMGGRIFYIGLSYTFGGASTNADQNPMGPPPGGHGMRGMGPGGPM